MQGDSVRDIDVAKKLVSLEKSAADRHIEFDMSFYALKKVLNTKKCFFTGVKLMPASLVSPNSITLDRIDASKGYTDVNVVACAKEFNSKKTNLTVAEIILLYKGLVKKNLI